MSRQSLKNVCRLLDEVQNEIPVEQSFLADLKRSIELDDKKQREARPNSLAYKPSSMNCIRQMYYQVTGTETDAENTSYVLVGICNSGSDIHERVQKYVDNMLNNDIDCEYIDVASYVRSRNLEDVEVISKQGMETKLYHKTLNMRFLCDGIIRYKGRYYILELKTESINKWQMRKGVDPSHYNQATAYCTALGLDQVLFVYIDRNLLDMKAFMYTVDEAMKNDFTERIMNCNQYVQDKKVPPIPEKVERKTCEYCSYKTRCRKDI